MKNLEEKPVLFSELNISPDEIYRHLGYGKAQVNTEVTKIINNLLVEIESACNPSFGYRIVKGEVTDKRLLILDNQSFNPGPIIAKYLKGCSSYVLLVATTGDSFNNWLTGVNKRGDILCSFIADSIGSTIADAISMYGIKYIESVATSKELYLTNSYSPGYCDWDVCEQQHFFSLLPDNFCGITLNDSCLMQPIKSISCVLGLDKKEKFTPYSCSICKRKGCYLRRVKR